MELYITLALLSVLLSLTLAFQIKRVDKGKRYFYFVFLMVATAVWSFFSIFWLLFPQPYILIFYKMSFIGVISVPVLLYLSSTEYAKGNFLPFHISIRYLWILPGISFLLMATNPWHGLFWKDIYPGSVYNGVVIYQYIPAIGYWVHTAYSYMLVLAALITFSIALLRKQSPWLLVMVAGGIMVPVVANILVITGATLIDYTPIMLSFACAGFGWTISVSFYTESIRSLEKLQRKTSDINSLYNVIVKLSEQLIQAEPAEVDKAINHTMAMLGRQNQVDRVYLFEYIEELEAVSNTYEWCNQGIGPAIEEMQELPFDTISNWKEKLLNNEHIYIESVDDMPDDVKSSEKEILQEQQITSLIVVPLFFGKHFFGFMGFDSVKGNKYWDETTVSLIRVMGNIIAGTLARIRYEKLLIQEKQNAETANKVKSQFLANMSHELRTPMNAILGFSRIAADTTDDQEVQEHLEIVLNSGNSLLQLINDLLDFSKIEAGMLRINLSEVHLSNILKFVKQTFEVQARQKGITLNIELDPSANKVFLLDESRLRQVLFNLVGNAVKFTHQGQIYVLVTAAPAAVQANPPELVDEPGSYTPNSFYNLQIDVVDTGIGISENDQQAIFEIFNQLSQGAGRKYEGTGLGLNISRRIIELMNGTIEVKSQLDEGSTFRVKLPKIKAI